MKKNETSEWDLYAAQGREVQHDRMRERSDALVAFATALWPDIQRWQVDALRAIWESKAEPTADKPQSWQEAYFVMQAQIDRLCIAVGRLSAGAVLVSKDIDPSAPAQAGPTSGGGSAATGPEVTSWFQGLQS